MALIQNTHKTWRAAGTKHVSIFSVIGIEDSLESSESISPAAENSLSRRQPLECGREGAEASAKAGAARQ